MTEHGTTAEASDAQGGATLGDAERKRILATYIATEVATKGTRVESQTDENAVLVYGKRVNHMLHLLLCVPTAGLWAVPWIIMAATGGEKRKVVRVDDYGNIL